MSPERFRKFLAGVSFAVTALFLAACGAQTNTAAPSVTAGSEASAQEEAVIPADVYALVVNGCVLYPDMEITVLPPVLGAPEGTFEEESCAAQGKAKLYAFPDFEIYTYPDGDRDLIQYLYLKTDRIKTPEGADLSMKKEEVEALYGTPDFEEGDRIAYLRGTMRLLFVFGEDGYPLSVEYRSGIMQ